jgi:hypothetical protein
VVHPPLPSEGVAPARPAHHQVSYHGAELPAAQFLSMPQQMAGQLQGMAVSTLQDVQGPLVGLFSD